MIPEIKIRWIDVIFSAIVTSLAFTVTNYILGFYVQTFTVAIIVEAAGSLLVILLLIFIFKFNNSFWSRVFKGLCINFWSASASTFTPRNRKNGEISPDV